MPRWQPGQSGNPAGGKKRKPLAEAIELALSRIDEKDPRHRKRFVTLGERVVLTALGQTGEDPANVRHARDMIKQAEGWTTNMALSDPDGQPLGVGLIQEMEAALARARAAVAAIQGPVIEGEAVRVGRG